MTIITVNTLEQTVATANTIYPSKAYKLYPVVVDSTPLLELQMKKFLASQSIFDKLPENNRPNHFILSGSGTTDASTAVRFPLTHIGDIIKIAEALSKLLQIESTDIYRTAYTRSMSLISPTAAYEVMSTLMNGAVPNDGFTKDQVHVGSGTMYIPAGDKVTYKINYINRGVRYTVKVNKDIYYEGGVVGPVVEYVNDQIWLSSTAGGTVQVPLHTLTELLHAHSNDKAIYDALTKYYVEWSSVSNVSK